MSVELSREQKSRQFNIIHLREYIRLQQNNLHEMIRSCDHVIIKDEIVNSAYCTICGEPFGWYCEKSPTKYCEYDVEHGEFCIHCGISEDRK